ncbi:unnamed protein product [Caenorhabditis auriculariae]|uniref:Rhodanese domain-containing protein n=1 Tax=Caenorhabditis auriculariae TaxID=2777116 RepID=A0A8S1H1N9_9PELO|nr:unnamed protein product [Caenorhabditis auriculariae]
MENQRSWSISNGLLPYAFVVLGGYALIRFINRFIPGAHNLPQMDFKNKTVVITGATSGLGESLTKQLHQLGAKLILLGRSQQKLKDLRDSLIASGGNPNEPETCVYDLEDPESAASQISFATDGFVVDVLINNAGLSVRGSTIQTKLAIFRKLMDVNLFGQISLTQALMPHLAPDGCIIAISSVQGKLSLPYRSAYSVSKHAFNAYFDSLRAEYANRHILVVSPGYISTGFGARALDVDGKPIGDSDEHSDVRAFITGKTV